MNFFYEKKPFRYCIAEACKYNYPPHAHDAIEIVTCEKGNFVLTIGGMKVRVMPGDIICIFPTQIHSYESVSQDADGLCVAFVPDLVPEYTKAFRSMVPENPLVRVESEEEELRDLLKRMKAVAGMWDHPQSVAYIHLFLSFVMSKLRLRALNAVVDGDMTHQVMQYIAEHLCEDLTLQSVSHAVGISKSHLSHIFSQRLHINFRHFINGMRIDQACVLLQDPGLSIKEICYRCGYENSRTFHRTFLMEYNMTPGEYRRQRVMGLKPEWQNVRLAQRDDDE